MDSIQSLDEYRSILKNINDDKSKHPSSEIHYEYIKKFFPEFITNKTKELVKSEIKIKKSYI
jgi:hypothetical protein